MTAGKARLWTGIGCVGTMVVFASASLYISVPQMVFPTEATTASREFVAVVLFLLTTAVLLLPFDFLGGILIPAAYEPHPPETAQWIRKWLRSVVIQLLFFSVTLFFYLQIGREVGTLWLLALFFVLQLTLVAGQELIWRIMTSAQTRGTGNESTQFVQQCDSRFAGGITGLPGCESILLPDCWRNEMPPSWLSLLIKRRQAAIVSGSRFRGIVAAIVWNNAVFGAALILGGGSMGSVADLVTVFHWFLLWSFLGLLTLPTLNRRAVFALDRLVADNASIAELQAAIRNVDQLTEQDPSRSTSAESVFQPIPCADRRVQQLRKLQSGKPCAWNIARTALFLSWAFGGPLARAVHCNVGRPELWALMPTD